MLAGKSGTSNNDNANLIELHYCYSLRDNQGFKKKQAIRDTATECVYIEVNIWGSVRKKSRNTKFCQLRFAEWMLRQSLTPSYPRVLFLYFSLWIFKATAKCVFVRVDFNCIRCIALLEGFAKKGAPTRATKPHPIGSAVCSKGFQG